MNWPPRWFALGAAAVLVAGVAAPASAEPPAPPPDAAASSAPAAGTPARVTLITGDVVELDRVAGGRVAATVRPAPGREGVTFHTRTVDGELRVLPADVVPYLASGVLDPDLFDVEELVADGYGDAAAAHLPLIVRYRDGSAGRVGALAAAADVRPLPSIDGAALAVGKDGLSALWSGLRTPPAGMAATSAGGRLGGGVERIWLDGRVRPALERSAEQIGAPTAWAAGRDGSGVRVAVLDTGIDADHPDLTGRVVGSQDFSDSGGVADGHGHGTHVAATIAGSGAASGGARKGVAPGARLLVGKVLDDGGAGYDSWIIAGMEWAARSGADVVNMSLGGAPSDGTDPMSAAIDSLTAETGALFVVAAGNSGADYSVGSPGAADAALTVGAVDRDDELADFSSRGPRVGDNGLKPEITAPGVGIVAARAAGTTMGAPVDEAYTAASGTSMATPHVAGAAAILAQEHPDWRAGQLKDALVSTARTHPARTVFAQGGGRVDVARVLGQRVYASAVADFRRIETGATDVPRREVTYTNLTGQPQTLRLRLDVRNVDSDAAEPDGFVLDGEQVTVPAGGSVRVPLRVDVAKLDRGRHSGWLVATGADGMVVRTALAATLSGPRHTVTFRAVDRAGKPTGVPVVALHGEQRESDGLGWLPEGGSVTMTVEEGPYLLHALIEDGAPLDEQATLVTDPQLTVTRDVEVLLDARKGTPVRIRTPRPAEQQATLAYYVHRVFGNGRQVDHGVMHFSAVQQVNVTPTRTVTEGEYEFASRWQLVAPMVDARVTGVSGPLDVNLLYQSPASDLRRNLPLVWAGIGSAAELARVRGAAALLRADPERSEEEQIAAAAAAGAAVVLVVRPADWSAWTSWRPIGDRFPVPAMVLPYDDGQRVIAAAAGGRARIDLAITVASPYLYDVMQVSKQRVPATIEHRVTTGNSVRLTNRYVDTGGFDWAKEQRFGWRPWQEVALETQRIVRTGTAREEWVSAGDTVWQQRVSHQYVWSELGPLLDGAREAPRRYTGGTRATQSWFAPLVRPALDGSTASAASRNGNVLTLRVPSFVDADGHAAPVGYGDTVRAALSRDGRPLADLSAGWAPVTTTAAPARYRLELETQRPGEEWRWAGSTRTAWEFRSAHPAGAEAEPLPLLQLDYRVPTDLHGTVPGQRPHRIGLALRHQPGVPAPRGTSVTVEVSFDDGAHWRRVAVRADGARYEATVPAGSGRVSLRVKARDAAGNTVEQTVIGAYGLR
ncbi:S8 family serine peptidase [Micromonospora deserti]|uniref:Peptidase S8 n=1 Tax=Micromonospora deserti TaxID=2070366 RepID=A0A2W2CGS1_9ACTN|nr:S8 family serine peptidase [Micromonospora deserti]PZF98585.1 peptidase S8 [Micromonospora deserti]